MKQIFKYLILFLLILPATALPLDHNTAEKRIIYLSSEITRHNYLYYVLGQPEISNQEYDRLYNELVSLEKLFPDMALPDSPTHRVGSKLENTFPLVCHPVPMLSLNKCYAIKDIISWAEKLGLKTGKQISFMVEEKIDGTAIELFYENGILVKAATRGDGQTGYDISANARTVRTIPLKLHEPLSIIVRGEVFIRKSDFKRLDSEEDFDFKSLRNLAAGALRRKHSTETAKIPLDIFIFETVSGIPDENMDHAKVLEWLKTLGFQINPNNRIINNISEIENHINKAVMGRDKLDYEIDGIVLKVLDRNTRKLLGTTDRFPRWAMAFKFESSQAITIIENIIIQISRLGRATPVAILKPVNIGSSIVSRAGLHNQNYINDLGLEVGDKVRLVRKGDVIPVIEEVLDKTGDSTWQMPVNCPSCNTRLKTFGKNVFCPNYECPEQVAGRLVWFAQKMKIRYLGPALIKSLLDQKKIYNPEDFYLLDPDDLEKLKGFGHKKILKFQSSLEKSKKSPFETVVLALGIQGLGRHNIRILKNAGYHSAEMIINAGQEKLAEIKGIGKKTAGKIIKGFNPGIKKTIKILKEQGIDI